MAGVRIFLSDIVTGMGCHHCPCHPRSDGRLRQGPGVRATEDGAAHPAPHLFRLFNSFNKLYWLKSSNVSQGCQVRLKSHERKRRRRWLQQQRWQQSSSGCPTAPQNFEGTASVCGAGRSSQRPRSRCCARQAISSGSGSTGGIRPPTLLDRAHCCRSALSSRRPSSHLYRRVALDFKFSCQWLP